MSHIKVAIYSGIIPSSVFIERLIEGLANRCVIVLLYGRKKKRCQYANRNIKVTGYTGKAGKIFFLIKYLVLLLIRKPLDLNRLIRYHINKRKFKESLNFLVKTAPIVFHKPDIFHIQWAKSIEDWMFLQEFGIKIVVSLRGAHINYSPVADESLAQMYRRNFPKVDAFHAVSMAVADEAGKYGCPPERAKVIYSGLNPEELKFSPKINPITGDFKIISIGRPHWKKGYSYSIDACRLLAERGFNFTYTIIGGLSEELLFQVHQLGLQGKVKLLPALPFDDTMSKLKDSDLLLLPSLEEGIANVVLEAMALGVPVLSTRCGGMEEAIKDNVNGFLVDTRSPAQIAESVIRIAKINDVAMLEILSEARRTIESVFNEDKMVNSMINLYQSVLPS